MLNKIKRLLCPFLSVTIIAGSMVFPLTAGAEDKSFTPLVEGDTVLKEWKFDFGAKDTEPDSGSILITPDTNYVTNRVDGEQYGFIGIDEESYKLGNRLDGFGNQRGQVIELAAGGSAENDAIGVVGAGGENGADISKNKADKYYPVRFALKVDDDTYYRIKAKVTTLDPNKDADVSLYTERKHPIYTHKEVKAGQVHEESFSIRVTPIYYEKSDPTGAIADGMVNVCVLGENSALVSLEIQQVKPFTTMWVLGDSTVTDGNCSLPFWPLANFTGVGTGLTKYLPRTMAMVNEGEGGLAAGDNAHYNMVANRIMEGDYMYVEYGHNHKNDGTAGYVSCLDKYYNKCNEKGAKLLIVSPVERINTWNSEKSCYNKTLEGFAAAGENYVKEKVAAGAKNIAYVDLNDFSHKFINKITADNGNDANAIKFYYQTHKNGEVDSTHPNDTGAENFAYEFMEAAKAVIDADQKAVVDGFLTGMTDEVPNLVPADVMEGGVGGKAWPVYVVPTSNQYPVVIKDVQFNEAGEAAAVKVVVQDAKIKLTSYGAIVITVYSENGEEKGKIYAIEQVDNSTGNGEQTIEVFTKDVVLGEGDTYSAIVLEAKDVQEDGHLKVVWDGKIYSTVFKPSDIEKHLILNDSGDSYENFEYYGAGYDGQTSDYIGLNNNGWSWIGSAGHSFFLSESGDTKFVTITSTGSGSFYPVKNLAGEIGTTGRYMFSADMQYLSGGGFTVKLVTGHSDKNRGGTESIVLFSVEGGGKIVSGGKEVGTISSEGFTNVSYIMDIDAGTAEVSVGGNEPGAPAPTVIALEGYQATDINNIKPSKLTQILFGENNKAFGVNMANLMVAKLKNKETKTMVTAAAAPGCEEMGSISVDGADENSCIVTFVNGTKKTKVVTEKGSSIPADKIPETPTHNLLPLLDTAAADIKDAALIKAVFEDKNLKKLDISKVDIAAGDTSLEIDEPDENTTYLLWSSVFDAVPLAKTELETVSEKWMLGGEEFTADTVVNGFATVRLDSDTSTEEEPEVIIKTLTAGSTAKVKAEPAENCVFMGWKTADGKLVSEDAEAEIRISQPVDLTAVFAREPGITDITEYKLVSDKASLKAEPGATFTVTAKDAKDASGTPFTKFTAEDVNWSTETEGVTVDEKGVVTITDSFVLAAGETKPIVINATLNDVPETCTVTAHMYDFYEDFNGGDLTAITAKNNWFVNQGSGEAKITDGALVLKVAGDNKLYSGMHFAAPEDVADKLVTIKYDYKASSVASGGGNNSSHLFMANLGLDQNTPTYNETYSGNKGVSLENGKDGFDLKGNTLYNITITINNATKTAQIQAVPADGGDTVTVEVANTKMAINTLYFRPGRNVTDTVDNVSVVIADAPDAE